MSTLQHPLYLNMKLIIEDYRYDQVGKSFSLQNFMGQAAIKEEEEALMREANVVCFMTLFKLYYVHVNVKHRHS